MLLRWMVAFIAVGALGAGCARPRPSEQREPRSDGAAVVAEGLVGSWRLRSLNGAALPDRLETRGPTMTVSDEGLASGLAGVNQWSASLDMGATRSGRFVLGPILTTLMAGSPEAMELERQFVEALESARSYDAGALSRGDLVLRDSEGKERLRFGRTTEGG